MRKRWIANMMVLCIILSAFAFSGCGAADTAASLISGTEETTLLEVDTVSPLITDIAVEGEYVGILEYEDQVSVVPLLNGEVTATYFEEGDYVEAGELLFTIDDEAYQLQLQNALIAYQQAQSGIDSQLGQLQMGRDSAANTVSSAQEGISQIQDSYDYFNSQLADLDETKADLAEDRADLKEDLLEVRDQISDLESAIESMQNQYNDLDEACRALERQIAAIPDNAENPSGESVSSDSPSSNTTTNSNMKAEMEVQLRVMKVQRDQLSNALSAARSTLSGLQSAEKQLDNAIAQYDSSMDQIDSSKDGIIYQRDNLDYNLEQALRGEQLAQAQLDYYDNYTIPSAQTSATTTLQQAQLGIDSARLQLSYTQVTAPVSGTIMSKNVEELGIAQMGYPAYVIISDEGAIASFGVPESTYRMLSLGQEVRVERNGAVYDGSIVEIPLQINPQTGLFTIKAAVKGDTDQLIMGTSVKVTLAVKHADRALTIPIDCVYYESGESYTYVLEGNIVRKVSIETGLYDDVNMQILSGITEDMQVITTWSSDLRDGLEVKVSDTSNVSVSDSDIE
ncbi:MAG: efflux RND transporter periplasmic adaptor subunit [Lachnospiraceae bacterium]|nr:efflux RND transporter periplasmic adaptor subunit [Lachnospiraceae bacterium]